MHERLLTPAEVAKLFKVDPAGWVTNEKVTPETKRPGELVGRVYARLTDAGRSVLEEWESRNG